MTRSRSRAMSIDNRSRSRSRTPSRSRSRSVGGVRQINRQMREAANNPTLTPGTRQYLRDAGSTRTYGASSSKSSGFLKVKKRVKKPKYKHNLKLLTGVSLTKETGSTVTDPNCVYVGHGTFASDIALRQVCLAIVKYLFAKKSITMVNSADQPTAEGSNERFNIQFFYYENSMKKDLNFFVVSGVVGWKFQDYADELYKQINDMIDFARVPTGSPAPEPFGLMDISFQEIVFESFNGSDSNRMAVHVNITKMMLHLGIKSSLKLQNRSTAADGDHAVTDVDNVPLYGKSYEAKGTAFRFIDKHRETATTGAYLPFALKNVYGCFKYSAANDSTGVLKEPPQPALFTNLIKHGKAKLDPGQLKTSVLTDSIHLTFEQFFKLYFRYRGSGKNSTLGVKQAFAPLGKSIMFSFEKMLGIAAEDSIDNGKINLAFEHNYWISVKVTNEKYKFSVSNVEIANYS